MMATIKWHLIREQVKKNLLKNYKKRTEPKMNPNQK